METKQYATQNKWVNIEIKRKSENTSRQMKLEIQLAKSVRGSKSSSNREVYICTGLPQETRIITNRQPNLSFKGSRKRRTSKAPSQQKDGNKKIREEINKIEAKNRKDH